MNRRATAAATMLGIALAEGSLGLSARHVLAQGPAPSPFEPLPRIQDTINAIVPPSSVVTPLRPPATRRVPTAPVTATTTAARPSPFAVPAASAVRPRAISATATTISPVPTAVTPTSVPGAAATAADLPDLPPAVGATAMPTDPSLQTTSTEGADPSMAKIVPVRRGVPTGEIAATVGAVRITNGELRMAILESLDGKDPSEMPPEYYEGMCRHILEKLIQRTLVIQAAKVKLKNEKNWDGFMKQIDGVWREHEIPELIQKYGVSDKYELGKAMERRGVSLERVREAFKLQTAANEFVRNELQGKMKVDLPEQRAYYEAHIDDFDRPAQVTWREVVVMVGQNKGRANALRKAEAILARLRRGEDFEAVVKAESEGPNASKGGIWETTPGSYAVPAVNEAIDNLPLGQVSGILEGADAYHIIRVEKRRPAGPASFAEVQLKIRDLVKDQKFNKAAEAYFLKLRDKTIITSPMFDGSPSAPPSVNAQVSAAPTPPATPQP